MITKKMISCEMNRAAAGKMMNRALLGGFDRLNDAIMVAKIIDGIEVNVRYVIEIISLLNPLLSRFTPTKAK